MRVILQVHPVIKVKQPGTAIGFHVHAVTPVKGVAFRHATGHTFNIACGALVAIGTDAPDMPHPLLLLAIVIDKVFI
ncbi:hypothetical protein D3C81_1792810 [compost metagenome]